MLQFLQTGKVVYVLAAVCILGILSKWLTRSQYKRLIKETDNMTLTRNKNLRAFKQKAEGAYRLNQGIPHVQPYLERQMYDFRYAGVSLNGWSGFSNQMTLLCFLLGGAAAFASYWFRCDSYYTVLYGSVGILAGLLTILVDNGTGLADKKQQLYVSLDNYLENALFNRLDKERILEQAGFESAAETARSGTRDAARSKEEIQSAEERVAPAVSASGRRKQSARAGRKESVRQAQQIQPAQTAQEEIPESRESGGSKDIDYLKKSLEQIAVSREKSRESRQGDNWLKDLDQDEIKLIGEIIKEYLS